MIHDVQVERIDEGPVDPMGHEFTMFVMNNRTSKFDDAIDREDVKLVFLRSLELHRGGGFTVRFTAYDADGVDITDKICGSLAQ